MIVNYLCNFSIFLLLELLILKLARLSVLGLIDIQNNLITIAWWLEALWWGLRKGLRINWRSYDLERNLLTLLYLCLENTRWIEYYWFGVGVLVSIYYYDLIIN